MREVFEMRTDTAGGTCAVRAGGVAALLVLALSCLAPGPFATARTTPPTRAIAVSYAAWLGPVRSDGWKWEFFVSGSGSTTQLFVTATSGAGPTEQHEWRWMNLPGSDFSVDPTDLRPTVLDTGTDLGAYGHLQGTLTDASPVDEEVLRCPATGEVMSTTRQREGRLSGSFAFEPNLTGLPAQVTRSAMPATVVKVTYTANTCPSRLRCDPYRSFDAYMTDPDGHVARVGATRGPTWAHVHLSYTDETVPGAFIIHSIFGEVPRDAVSIAPTGVTIRARALAPSASGRLEFSLSDPQTSGRKCLTTTYVGTHVRGKITAAFANGDEIYRAPFWGSEARVIRPA